MRALACFLCLAACDAGAKPEPAQTKAPVTAKVAIPPTQAAANPSRFNLAYLPGDADVLVHVDVARLRKSKLWPSYSHDAAKLLVAGFSGCDYDPMTQIASVDIGIPITSGLTVFVIRDIDREKSLACFHRDERATFDGDVVTLKTLRGTRVMKFADDHTLVMQGLNKSTKQTLQQVISSGTPLAADKELAAALVRAQSEAALTAVSRPGSEALAQQTALAGVRFASFIASLDLTEKLSVNYVMDMNTLDDATLVANMMHGQLDNASVKQLFDQLDVRTQDKTVILTVGMGETKLASFAGMMRGMIPEP